MRNYGKTKTARWNSDTIKWGIELKSRTGSASYEVFRKYMFNFPARSTLRAYTGKMTGEVGVPPIVEKRLAMEALRWPDKRQRTGSLGIDEMTFARLKRYKNNMGRYYGRVDMGGVVPAPNVLANKMLALVWTPHCAVRIKKKLCV